MKVIVVTGTPGTGKTTLAKRIAREKKYKYFDVNALIKDKKLRESYDMKRQTYNVNVKKLNKFLLKLILEEKDKKTKGMVLDSHLSHYLPARYVDLCVVTKTDLKRLKRRLEKRGYSKNKVRENLDAEIFDVCLQEAKEEGHKVSIIKT
mgnify:CR=1 FL=1